MAIKNILNIKEFKELIDKYKSITLKQIIDIWDDYTDPVGDDIMRKLTGFGSIATCKLCLAIPKDLYYSRERCNFCIYSLIEHETNKVYKCCTKHFTYGMINDANTPEKLYNAIQARIAYMESILEELKID